MILRNILILFVLLNIGGCTSSKLYEGGSLPVEAWRPSSLPMVMTPESGGPKFGAFLFGTEKVPEVSAEALGSIAVEFDPAYRNAKVMLKLWDATKATEVYLHCAKPGKFGPVAFKLSSPDLLLMSKRPLIYTLSNADFSGVDCVPAIGRPVNDIATLALAMKSGFIYIEIDSPSSPGGKTRGHLAALVEPPGDVECIGECCICNGLISCGILNYYCAPGGDYHCLIPGTVCACGNCPL